MTGPRASRRYARLSALLAIVAATGACASRAPEVELADQLLARERAVFAARTRDSDTAARRAAEMPALLTAACEQQAAARIEMLNGRIENAELSLMARFESSAWALQWESQPRSFAPRLAAFDRRIAAADAAAATAAAQAASHPNDSRLAAAQAAAAAEQAKLRAERLSAERDETVRLAARIEGLRESTRARIEALYAPIADQLRSAAATPCRWPVTSDPTIGAARRAAYAELHSAQVEGLVTLRGRPDRAADRAQPRVDDALHVLAAPGSPTATSLPVSPDDPVFLAGVERADRAIESTESALAAWIDASFDELRRGSGPAR